MATKPSIWERIVRLLLTEKRYVLRVLKMESVAIESRVSLFAEQVSAAELSIVNTVEDLRNLELRNVGFEDRHMLVSVKVEGVGAEFQKLQNSKRFDEAKDKSDLLEELINEQVSLETSIAENNDRISKQKKNVKELRRSLSELKDTLRKAEDNKNELLARYNTVQAMDAAQATVAMLESGAHADQVAHFTSQLKGKEALAAGKKEVRELSEERQFELLEREMAVKEKLEQYTTPLKGIQ